MTDSEFIALLIGFLLGTAFGAAPTAGVLAI